MMATVNGVVTPEFTLASAALDICYLCCFMIDGLSLMLMPAFWMVDTF
jgi:hypothetical protein